MAKVTSVPLCPAVVVSLSSWRWCWYGCQYSGVDVAATAVGGSGVDVDVTAVGGRAGGGAGVAVSNFVDVVSSAVIREVT